MAVSSLTYLPRVQSQNITLSQPLQGAGEEVMSQTEDTTQHCVTECRHGQQSLDKVTELGLLRES